MRGWTRAAQHIVLDRLEVILRSRLKAKVLCVEGRILWPGVECVRLPRCRIVSQPRASDGERVCCAKVGFVLSLMGLMLPLERLFAGGLHPILHPLLLSHDVVHRHGLTAAG